MNTAKKSETTSTYEVIFPQDVNHYGTLFGGRLLSWMDKVAYYTAVEYCGYPSVTASIEHIDFAVPLRNGDLVILEGKVIYTGKTSMVIKIDVFKKEVFLNRDKISANTGFFTFVALNETGKPQPIPPLLIESGEEKKLFELGKSIKTKAVERNQPQEESKD